MSSFFEIITSMFENVNYDQKFFIMNFIIVFNRNHFFEQISNKMLIIVFVLLRKNNFNNFIENIDFYSRRFNWIKITKNRNNHKNFFQNFENFTNFFQKKSHIVFKRIIFFSFLIRFSKIRIAFKHFDEKRDDFEKVSNETLIKIREIDELHNVNHRCKFKLIAYDFKFVDHHLNFFDVDSKVYKINNVRLKLTLISNDV